MKPIRKIFITSFALLTALGALVAKPVAGPKGGRIVTTSAPHIEFFVEKDRTATVSFYDQDLKPVPPGAQVINATAEAGTGKVNLAFSAKDSSFVSSAPLPAGDGFTVVLQIREAAGAKPKNYRILFHDEICSECRLAEYACVCDDAGNGKNHD